LARSDPRIAAPGPILIGRRYCGPPDSGNGGYVSGRLAAFIGGAARVRLQAPTPLETGLEVRRAGDGVELVAGTAVIAWARPAKLELDVPRAPGFDEAQTAARGYRGFADHPFPRCFVCGPARGTGDGLRIFPGLLPGRGGLVACPWIPDASLADDAGKVRPEFLWSALDCPGAFSYEREAGSASLLGELTAELRGTVAAGERCIAIGWELAREGRKHHTGTALFSESGELRGLARATWFEVPPRP
jgi:hypothetical protein